MANYQQQQPQQLNLGPLILILVLSGLVLRYLFVAPPAPQQSQPGGRRGGGGADATQRDREDAAQRILQIFPHVDRRSLLWDLQRTGGNVDATTERILTGRLTEPPITFQPPPPPAPPGTTAAGTTTSSQPAQAAHASLASLAGLSSQSDLISRYNLQGKLAAAAATSAPEEEELPAGKKRGKAWSSNREERQAALQKRREDMILAARRKMEAKLAAKKN